ncbi:response regulator receiver protein [[Leptolyngbya] sp. PCC 7376]|uniref:response regulator n=1 Tax=[Leptolyngbya] sp. PCC 7376 TaxID=111781 RepID=UPI00029F2228|nr:response regulator [[Leptolyngbya] sp. PCC 7376]AFY36690.1 response regulator receiver protein [[Leptolyngbya] sp. PCC 7376]
MPKSSQPFLTRVLIVEDDHINRAVFSKQMEQMQYDVASVKNGKEAAEYCSNNCVDIILMDCAMPVMNGYEAATKIRQEQYEQSHSPVIIGITAYAMPGDRQKCLAAGMDDYLAKPVYIKDLKTMLDKWSQPLAV